jgi:hypothetical protein
MAKSFDLYGNEQGVNFQGIESYKTIHGACFSIFIVLVIFNVAYVNMVRFIFKQEPESIILNEFASSEKYKEFGSMDLYEKRAQFAFEF